MKNKINKILLNEYIINSSDLLEITNSNEFIDMIKDINIDKEIVVKSKLIHKNNISLLESILFGIDNYISFLKNIFNINQLEIRYILTLTIFDNNYLFSDKYYYDNMDYFNNIYKEIIMNKYIKNAKFLSKYKNINIYTYEQLINKINQNKNRAYVYFEDINQKNALYYLNIYEYNDSI